MKIDYSLYTRGLTYADLCGRWQCSSRQARRLVVRHGIAPVRLGHRTVRFRLQDVERAEMKLAEGEEGKR